MAQTFVLYHGVATKDGAKAGCYDGFGAAWAMRREMQNRAEYIPVAYGQPVPELPAGSWVFLVDFSYPRETMLELAETHQRVYVYDHHKTAEAALKGLEHPNLDIHFDMTKSGALITWEQRHSKKDVPQLIKFISDRDLWQFKLPGSLEVHTVLQSYPFDFGVWDGLYEDLEDETTRARIIAEGRAIVRFRDQQVEQTCSQARLHLVKTTDRGWSVPVVNATGMWSEVANKLLELYPDRPFSVAYFFRADGKVQLSLRSRPDFDCSVIAKHFGGGGHAQAAGCELEPDVAYTVLGLTP